MGFHLPFFNVHAVSTIFIVVPLSEILQFGWFTAVQHFPMLHGCVFDVIFDVIIVLFCWVQQNICSTSGGSTLKCCARAEQCWTRLRLVQHYSRSHNIFNVEPPEVEQMYNVCYHDNGTFEQLTSC